MDAAPLVTIEELSAQLKVPVATLYRWRHRGDGPRSLKVGRHVRYVASEVAAWLEQQ